MNMQINTTDHEYANDQVFYCFPGHRY